VISALNCRCKGVQALCALLSVAVCKPQRSGQFEWNVRGDPAARGGAHPISEPGPRLPWMLEAHKTGRRLVMCVIFEPAEFLLRTLKGKGFTSHDRAEAEVGTRGSSADPQPGSPNRLEHTWDCSSITVPWLCF